MLYSAASDLGPTDNNGTVDVYLEDLTTGAVSLVSANGARTDAGNGLSIDAVFSPNGQSIAFQSQANDLGPRDTPRSTGTPSDETDVYIRDLTGSSDSTGLVSVNGSRTNSGGGPSVLVGFLTEEKVVFTSEANNLGQPDSHRESPASGGDSDVYVRDLRSGTNVLVSVNADNTDSGDGASWASGIARDGATIAFASAGSDFGPTDSPRPGSIEHDIYVGHYRGDADLSVDMTSVGSGPVRFGATVTHHGPNEAEDVSAFVKIPDGTSYVSASTTAGTCSAPPPSEPRVVHCTLGRMEPGANAHVAVVADVSAPPGTQLTAIAAVGASTGDFDFGDNSVQLTFSVE